MAEANPKTIESKRHCPLGMTITEASRIVRGGFQLRAFDVHNFRECSVCPLRLAAIVVIFRTPSPYDFKILRQNLKLAEQQREYSIKPIKYNTYNNINYFLHDYDLKISF